MSERILCLAEALKLLLDGTIKAYPKNKERNLLKSNKYEILEKIFTVAYYKNSRTLHCLNLKGFITMKL